MQEASTSFWELHSVAVDGAEKADTVTKPKRLKTSQVLTSPFCNPEPPPGFIADTNEAASTDENPWPRLVYLYDRDPNLDLYNLKDQSPMVSITLLHEDLVGRLAGQSANAALLAKKYGWQAYTVTSEADEPTSKVIMLPRQSDPKKSVKAFDVTIIKLLGKGSSGTAQSCKLGDEIFTLKTIELRTESDETMVENIIRRETCWEMYRAHNSTRKKWVLTAFLPNLLKVNASYDLVVITLCAWLIAANALEAEEVAEKIRFPKCNMELAEEKVKLYSSIFFTIAVELGGAFNGSFGYDDESASNLIASLKMKLDKMNEQSVASLQRLAKSLLADKHYSACDFAEEIESDNDEMTTDDLRPDEDLNLPIAVWMEFETMRDEGQLCLLSDYYPMTLFDYTSSWESSPYKDTIDRYIISEIMIDLLMQVRFIHDGDCVHRDIKPLNILGSATVHNFKRLSNGKIISIKRFGFRAHLSDFGVTRSLTAPQSNSAALLAPCPSNNMTEGIGGAFYTAPEVLNCASYGKPCDIFSLGVLYYFLLASCSGLFSSLEDLTVMIRSPNSTGLTTLPKLFTIIYSDESPMIAAMLSNAVQRPTADICLKMAHDVQDSLANHMPLVCEDDIFATVGISESAYYHIARTLNGGIVNYAREASDAFAKYDIARSTSSIWKAVTNEYYDIGAPYRAACLPDNDAESQNGKINSD